MPLRRADGSSVRVPQESRSSTSSAVAPITGRFLSTTGYTGRTLFEVGESISGITLCPNYGEPPTSVMLTDDQGNTPIPVRPSAGKVIVPYSYRLTEAGSVALSLLVTSKSGRSTTSLTLRFAKRLMWGGLPTGQTAEGLGLLPNVTLADDRFASFEVRAGRGNKLWVSYPSEFGLARFKIGKWYGGMLSPRTVKYENPFGVKDEFLAYESVNANIGDALPVHVEVL